MDAAITKIVLRDAPHRSYVVIREHGGAAWKIPLVHVMSVNELLVRLSSQDLQRLACLVLHHSLH